jgi:hypothetical protein
LTCDPATSKCASHNYGSKCTKDDECYGLGPTTCRNETCKAIFSVGDKCSGDAICAPGYKCSSSHVCEGEKLGAKCSATAFCDAGLTCKISGANASCVAFQKPGDKCSATELCDPSVSSCISEKCVKYFTGKAGDACNSERICDVKLACVAGKCVTAEPFVYKTCKDDADCEKTKGKCECNPNTGNKFCVSTGANATAQETPCRSKFKDYTYCMGDKCSAGSGLYVAGACGYDKCKSKLQSYMSCQCALSSKMTNCQYFPTCSAGIPTWAIILIIVGGLLVIVLLVLALTRACRGGYESIS